MQCYILSILILLRTGALALIALALVALALGAVSGLLRRSSNVAMFPEWASPCALHALINAVLPDKIQKCKRALVTYKTSFIGYWG